jgi:PBP1b-binding outer membrane lipoprotein LpoB
MFSFLLDFKKGLQKIKFNYKLRFIMFKVSLVFLLALMCNGCASSATNHSSVSKASAPTKNVDNRLVKYATNQGCKMLKSGYMVCPKSMNR